MINFACRAHRPPWRGGRGNDHTGIDRFYLRIGTKLRNSRKKQNITQEALAFSVGYDRTSITNIETGTQHAPFHTLLILCEALGVDISAMEGMLAPSARREGRVP